MSSTVEETSSPADELGPGDLVRPREVGPFMDPEKVYEVLGMREGRVVYRNYQWRPGFTVCGPRPGDFVLVMRAGADRSQSLPAGAKIELVPGAAAVTFRGLPAVDCMLAGVLFCVGAEQGAGLTSGDRYWFTEGLAARARQEQAEYVNHLYESAVREIAGPEARSMHDVRCRVETLVGERTAAEQQRDEMAAFADGLLEFIRRIPSNDLPSDLEMMQHSIAASPRTRETEAVMQDYLQERADAPTRTALASAQARADDFQSAYEAACKKLSMQTSVMIADQAKWSDHLFQVSMMYGIAGSVLGALAVLALTYLVTHLT